MQYGVSTGIANARRITDPFVDIYFSAACIDSQRLMSAPGNGRLVSEQAALKAIRVGHVTSRAAKCQEGCGDESGQRSWFIMAHRIGSLRVFCTSPLPRSAS